MLLHSFIKSQLYQKKSPNLTKLGFDYTADANTEFLKIQSMLYTEYHIKCESMLTIMKKFNIPSSKTMDTLFRLFDIESRSFSEANTLSINSHRSIPGGNGNTFTHIYHTAWNKEIFYLRSTYEQDYAKLLDVLNIEYHVEHLRIKYFNKSKNRYRIAIPDFYLPETNTIVEVKSTYWLDVEEMIEKRNAYINLGYKFHLYLDHVLHENW